MAHWTPRLSNCHSPGKHWISLVLQSLRAVDGGFCIFTYHICREHWECSTQNAAEHSVDGNCRVGRDLVRVDQVVQALCREETSHVSYLNQIKSQGK